MDIKIGTIYRKLIHSVIDPIVYSGKYIKWVDRVRRFPSERRRISVAITHYERPKLLPVVLKNIFYDERVSEIVVLDDGSSPGSLSKCIENLKSFKTKVKLFRRRENLGAFATKVQACSLCSNSWCILLDSDNTIFTSYVDAIFKLQSWEEDIIYCPGYAFPHFDFRCYGNAIFDFEDICILQKQNRLNGPFINDGNYFLNINEFTKALKSYKKFRVGAADVAFANYIWLSSGNRLRILRDASYYHRVHAKSNWILNADTGYYFLKLIMTGFENEMRATLENLLPDFQSGVKINQDIENIPL
jgi:glycosyltransferase involved in cell wall biosynthesis